MKVDFNKIFFTGEEKANIADAMDGRPLCGGGKWTAECEKMLCRITGAKHALLTTSGTSGLDVAAFVLDIKDGDEVIVPTYTFVASINSFVSRGAKPVFCDVKAETLNLDETKLEALITPRTKVIVPVHYAGVACNMDAIMQIAARHNIAVVEDAAQGIGAAYKGVPLGTIGVMGMLSFHSSKNIIAGEGGALLTNDDALARRANYIREKGTNRIDFVDGIVDKYTWVDYGGNFVPPELSSAFLAAQLKEVDSVTRLRRTAWRRYADALAPIEKSGKLHLCKIPEYAQANGHIFYVYTDSIEQTDALKKHLSAAGIGANSHFAPLHLSPMAKRLCGEVPGLPVAEKTARTMLRLPMFAEITPDQQQYVCAKLFEFFGE